MNGRTIGKDVAGGIGKGSRSSTGGSTPRWTHHIVGRHSESRSRNGSETEVRSDDESGSVCYIGNGWIILA